MKRVILESPFEGVLNSKTSKNIKPCIYKITNPNGRVYIGQTVNVWRRYRAYKGNHSSVESQIKLYNSFQKYGFDAHKFEVIYQCDKEFLNESELFFVKKYNAVKKQNLNCLGGGGSLHTHSKEMIKKRTDKIRGIPRSKETKEKISKANKGKLNGMYKQIPWNLGKPITLETRELLSKKLKQYYIDNPDFGRKGSKHSPETLKLISEKTKGKNIGELNKSFKGYILAYDLSGKFIGKYEGLRPASEKLGVTFQGISKAILNNRPFKGYKFKRQKSR